MIVCDCWKIPSLQGQANSRPSDATRPKPGAAQRLVKVKIKSAIACVTQHVVICPDEPPNCTFQPVAILHYLLVAVTIKVAQGKRPIVMTGSEMQNHCLISKNPMHKLPRLFKEQNNVDIVPLVRGTNGTDTNVLPFLLMTSAEGVGDGQMTCFLAYLLVALVTNSAELFTDHLFPSKNSITNTQ